MIASVVEALGWFVADERFQVAVGGNPAVVERMIADAQAIYAAAAQGIDTRQGRDAKTGPVRQHESPVRRMRPDHRGQAVFLNRSRP